MLEIEHGQNKDKDEVEIEDEHTWLHKKNAYANFRDDEESMVTFNGDGKTNIRY